MNSRCRNAATAFGRASKKLGIEIIEANSPRAKRRVERKHGLLQDRLVKKLALADILCFEQTRVLGNDWTIRYHKVMPINRHMGQAVEMPGGGQLGQNALRVSPNLPTALG